MVPEPINYGHTIGINSGGQKIFPEEVKAALKTHSEAHDCPIVDVP